MIATCWHCGESLPPDPPQANVAGIRHAVCCNGCRAVAEWIADLGLADYYRLRTGPAARAPDPRESEASAAAFLRPELSRHLVRTLADGSSEAIVLIDGMHCTACCWLIERTLGRLAGRRRGQRQRGCAAGAHRVRRKGAPARPDRRRARTRRLPGAAARPRRARRYAPARNARRAEAPRSRRLRRDAGDDVRERAVVRRVRRRRRRHARLLPLADAAGGDPGGVLFGGAVLRGRLPPRQARAGSGWTSRWRSPSRSSTRAASSRSSPAAPTSGSSRSACSSSSSAPAAISKCGRATMPATCPTRSRG